MSSPGRRRIASSTPTVSCTRGARSTPSASLPRSAWTPPPSLPVRPVVPSYAWCSPMASHLTAAHSACGYPVASAPISSTTSAGTRTSTATPSTSPPSCLRARLVRRSPSRTRPLSGVTPGETCPPSCLHPGTQTDDEGRDTLVMAMTAVSGDFGEPTGLTGCWCCGDRTVRASLLRLGEHPEVGVCFRCIRVLAHRKLEIERRTPPAPVGWPFWRRVLFRVGYNRC